MSNPFEAPKREILYRKPRFVDVLTKPAREPKSRKPKVLSDEQKAERREYARQYVAQIDVRMRSYIGRANKKGYSFTLTREEFEQLVSQCCVYCGNPGGSIDRIDSSQGYTPENSQPTCGQCNKMKLTLSHEQFIALIKQIASRF